MPEDDAKSMLQNMVEVIRYLEKPGPLTGLSNLTALLRQNAHSYNFFEVDRAQLASAIESLRRRITLASHGMDQLSSCDYLLINLLLNMAGSKPEEFTAVDKEAHAPG